MTVAANQEESSKENRASTMSGQKQVLQEGVGSANVSQSPHCQKDFVAERSNQEAEETSSAVQKQWKDLRCRQEMLKKKMFSFAYQLEYLRHKHLQTSFDGGQRD